MWWLWIDGFGGFSDNGYSFIGCVLMVVIVVLVVDCGCGCGLMVVVVGAGEDVSEKRKWISTPGVTLPIRQDDGGDEHGDDDGSMLKMLTLSVGVLKPITKFPPIFQHFIKHFEIMAPTSRCIFVHFQNSLK